MYKLAEHAVEAALTLAHESGEWLLADEALPVFEKLLGATRLATRRCVTDNETYRAIFLRDAFANYRQTSR
ncbi:hypothetical protein [Paraburkholderia azotifigens]|uniref:Uncharacterized protein n=1 Tax=Paraburkholderia azotifigens TaxID=2057004 RepID=A0ABU9R3K4_9BURK